MPAERDAIEAEALDKGRFARTRRAGYADANGTAGVRQQRPTSRPASWRWSRRSI
jgi:hypothetical protein